MLLKYVGSRKSTNIVCSGRATYYFGPENDYVVDVEDMNHVTQILKSILHRCVVVNKRPEKSKTPKVEKPKEENKPEVEAPKKRRRRKEK
ncbi:hypothetical protein LCGC14_1312850 [marine sediment metagenome]|uniref:Uncharacterized protein n=1 Tax=marine sediment metagenome TaxID=412755 RepID=A0A0F9N2S0_9ZZZZ